MVQVGDDLYETTVEVTVSRDMLRSVRQQSPAYACLVVLSGPRLGHRTVLSDQPIDIGRGAGCGLVLESDSVSRKHARIEWDGSHHRAVDLGSTNGSFVNEGRIAERVLADGDRLQIGKILIKYIGGGNVEASYHEEIQRLVHFDGLTGAYNKAHFHEALKTAVLHEREAPQPITLIVFDLDHFKNINDTHGHTAGDAVLRQTASVVQSQLSGSRMFARVGGEEFAVLMPGESLDAGLQMAEHLRQAVAASQFSFDGVRIPVTVSIGVAERAASSSESPDALYKRADTALYAAKGSGRNCVRS